VNQPPTSSRKSSVNWWAPVFHRGTFRMVANQAAITGVWHLNTPMGCSVVGNNNIGSDSVSWLLNLLYYRFYAASWKNPISTPPKLKQLSSSLPPRFTKILENTQKNMGQKIEPVHWVLTHQEASVRSDG
jgi:hypothetical protein